MAQMKVSPVSETGNETGVRLSEAADIYCRPDILKQYRTSGEQAGWSTRRVISRLNGLSPREILRNEAVDVYKAAEKSIMSDLLTKIRDGRLITTGFVEGPSDRDPDANRRRIPDDVLMSRDCRINRQKETISGNGLTFTGVRVYAPNEPPEFARSLVGRSLAECFKLVVVDDWVRQEMEEPIFNRYPDWKFRSTSYAFIPADYWPVRFEDWSDAAYTVQRFIYPVTVVENDDPDPPADVVLVRNRVEVQARRLITWLRDGTLFAEGIKEPKDHALTRQVIPSDWWRQPDVEMDTAESSLRNPTTPKRPCIFSDIRIVAPAASIQEAANAESRQDVPRTKGKPGRKRTWDWDGAIRELIRIANTPDGLPHPQAAIEKNIADWFLQEYGDHPVESAIRDFVVKFLPSDYHTED